MIRSSLSHNPILAVVGPTASGKTELAVRLAKEHNAEIISADSRQVFRYLAVGTAKPQGEWVNPMAPGTKAWCLAPRFYAVEGIPYHLVDFLEPTESFSAAQFVQEAERKITEIQARGKKPILVGGTGLYFKALSEGLAALPKADPKIRERLKKESEHQGRSYLHSQLARVDPRAAAAIPANNIQRLVRALEVYELTGKPISVWHDEHQARRRGTRHRPLAFVGIEWPREELHRRIETRCRFMVDHGMVEETQALLGEGTPETCPAFSGLGYPRVIAYLKSQVSRDELLRLLIQDTRQYAKRQMTWFRHQLPVEWSPWKK